MYEIRTISHHLLSLNYASTCTFFSLIPGDILIRSLIISPIMDHDVSSLDLGRMRSFMVSPLPNIQTALIPGFQAILVFLVISCIVPVGADQVNYTNNTTSLPHILWEQSYGGSQNDSPNIIIPIETGYVVAGTSDSQDGERTAHLGEGDFWILNLSKTGEIVWEKTYGGSRDDVPYSIQQTQDGGYVVAGRTQSADGNVTGNHGDYDAWVIRLSADGSLVWQKSLGGSQYEHLLSIENTQDNGFIAAGCSNSSDGDITGNYGDLDAWLIKLASNGTIEWQKNYGGSKRDIANNVKVTTDGGFIVAGNSFSHDHDLTHNQGGSDFWVTKLDPVGTLVWQKTFGGTKNESAYYVQQARDQGYIVVGRSESNDGDVTGNHGGYDFWVVKLSHDGEIEWEKSVGGSQDDEANSVVQDDDGGYIVSGGSASSDGDVTGNHGDSDYWMVKLSPDGTMEWQKSLGGTAYDYGQSVSKTHDGGHIMAGESQSADGDVTGHHGKTDYWVVQIDQ